MELDEDPVTAAQEVAVAETYWADSIQLACEYGAAAVPRARKAPGQ